MRRFFLAAVLSVAAPFPALAQANGSSATLALDSLLNTPISTAAKYAQGVRQVVGSVTIVTAEDIRRFGYRNLGDVMNSMAGVYGDNHGSVGIRGFGRLEDNNTRLLLLIDGHAVSQSMWGLGMLGNDPLNLSAVERIELIRGPASALYGTGAMFGIINVIPKRGADIAGLQVDGEMGSLGRRAVSFSAGAGRDGRRSIALSGMYESTDGNPGLFFPEFNDSSTNIGLALNLDWQRRGGLTLNGALGGFTLRSRLTYRRRAAPTPSHETTSNDPDAQILDRSGFVELGYGADLSAAQRLSVRTYYDDLSLQGPALEGGTGEAASHHIAGGEATLRWDLSVRDRLTTGVEYRNNLNSEYVSPFGRPRTTGVSRSFAVWSFYAQNELQIGPTLAFLAGIRHDESPIARGATTPRAALIYDPRPGTTLKAMYGRAFRTPNITETEFQAPSVTGPLQAETLDMLELIWMQRLNSRFMLTTSAYHYRAVNLIDAAPDSAIGLVYSNGDVARATGLELTMDGRPARGTTTYLSYSGQFAIDAVGGDQGDWLPDSPRHLLKAGFAADLASRATGAIELRYESARKGMGGVRLDPSLVGNLNLTLRPFHGGVRSGPELGFRITNLFNTCYANPGGPEQLETGIAQGGRAFILRLTTRF